MWKQSEMLQGHQSDWITGQLYFPADFVPGGRQNSVVKVRFKGNNLNANGDLMVLLLFYNNCIVHWATFTS